MIEVINKKADVLTIKSASGTVIMSTACAQMQMKDEAGDGYLTLCWTLEPGDSFAFYITDEPIYEYMMKPSLTDEEMEEFDIRCFEGDEYTVRTERDYDGPYGAQLKELLNLLAETMKKHGLKMKTVKKAPAKRPFVKNTEKKAGVKPNFSKPAGKTEKKQGFKKKLR